ncbi:MAG: hypothetical protein JKY56_11290 [Kofleriaceae bacterium]|nr:hypothetical protein [Kofleriaceae bacterium]
MNIARSLVALAFALPLTFGLLACEPQGGGQTGSELNCVDTEECIRDLGEGYVCDSNGVCIDPAAARSCPTTCDDWCPLTAACEVPDGCENPGCRCQDGACDDPGPVCPTTCEDWCPLTASCDVPDGCENPGCRCQDGICDSAGDICPSTCTDWCPMALECTVPDGCENPGCRCAEGDCR